MGDVESGHVFITHGDLTRLACDAWLMPCGVDGRPQYHWWTEVERDANFLWPSLPPGWAYDGRRCFKLYDRHYDSHGHGLPTPWVTNVGGGRRSDISWFVDGVREFMLRVSQDEDLHTPLHGRTRPLVGLPVVGTGYGGARRRAGQIVRALLPLLYESAEVYGFDVVLVAYELTDYAAAQQERRAYHRQHSSRWPELPIPLRKKAQELAELASAGDLVLFLGAGVSHGAGLPTWSGLLQGLAQEPGLMNMLKWDDLLNWGYADQARIIERALGGKAQLGAAIARQLSRRHYSLSHAMLATLPSEQIVTTNYDQLFESASEAIRRPVAVLPYESVKSGDRWVLKMHGCISQPEDIVLTREDYLRYAEQRRALAGVVQSLLITKHMLFVGFSLDDENFHRIADDVRKVVWTEDAAPFATSVVLVDRPFLAQLWHGEIEMVVMMSQQEEDVVELVSPARQMKQGARRLEIFLDYMLAQVADPNYLLDPRFEQLLTDDEAELRRELSLFMRNATPGMKRTAAWKKIERLFKDLGWDSRRSY